MYRYKSNLTKILQKDLQKLGKFVKIKRKKLEIKRSI